MNLRKSKTEDFKMIEKIYKSMVGKPFCAWDEEYPSIEDIENDHKNNGLFVLEENGKIIGAISVVFENIDFDCPNLWLKNKRACEISRAVIKSEFQGKGLAKLMVKMLAEILENQGFEAIRLSVAKSNLPALKTYQKLGFKILKAFTEFDIDFYLCETLIVEIL